MEDVYEKKIEFLRERKDDLEMRLGRAEDELRDSKKSAEEYSFEMRMHKKQADEEIG